MAAHRFWRVKCTSQDPAGNGYYAIAELALRTSAGGPNLALSGAVASASSIYPNEPSDPSRAIDGDPSTRWNSTYGAPQWLAVDLGAGQSADVQEVVITARNDTACWQAPHTGSVQWSDDGTTWTDAWAFTAVPWSQGQAQVFTFTPTRVLVTQLGTEAWGYTAQPQVRATAVGTEAWGWTAQPEVRATAVGTEAWGWTAQPQVRATAAGAEVWVDIARPWSAPSAIPIVFVVT